MDYMMYVGFVAIAIMAFLMVMISLTKVVPFRREITISLFIATLGVSYLSLANFLSHPKPTLIMLAWDRPDVEEAIVLAQELEQDKAIYLLLKWEGAEYPRYFVYPWSKEMAEQLIRAKRENAEKRGPGVMMRMPFDRSLDRRMHPWFHPIPVPKMMEPKGDSEPEIHRYEHPGTES